MGEGRAGGRGVGASERGAWRKERERAMDAVVAGAKEGGGMVQRNCLLAADINCALCGRAGESEPAARNGGRALVRAAPPAPPCGWWPPRPGAVDQESGSEGEETRISSPSPPSLADSDGTQASGSE